MANYERNEYIAGRLTSQDWQARKKELNENRCEHLWATTFDEFLMARLRCRYLAPIKTLQDNDKFLGEGFTIVSVQCALIEFLAALKLGKRYKHQKNGEKLGQHEYANSNALFCEFLVREEPFKEYFSDISAAREFYKNVRCALLHEARTKNGWRIWASGDDAVDVTEKIVRRDKLQAAIESYLESYGSLLKQDEDVQDAFIRKFDHLADI